MLTGIHIVNYVLIDRSDIVFSEGMTTITGETGAGKSIILGGLGLTLGQRTSLDVLKNPSKKCIVEATFSISGDDLKPFFKDSDIDFETETTLRREILPSGKSRAFINDTPVNLGLMGNLGKQLISIHSQHQALELTKTSFQFFVLDTIAENENLLREYSSTLEKYRTAQKLLNEYKQDYDEAKATYDYNLFCLNELREIDLTLGLQSDMETQVESLSNVENIGEKLNLVTQTLSNEQTGVLSMLVETKHLLSKLSDFGRPYEDLHRRISSTLIELRDVNQEVEGLIENLDTNPEILEQVSSRLQRLYDLQKKHGASDEKTLMSIKNDLEQKVSFYDNANTHIREHENRVSALELLIKDQCKQLHRRRKRSASILCQQLQDMLQGLGMPDAKFEIELKPTTSFLSTGFDELNMRFSPNKGSEFGDVKKRASGGEISRIMLCISHILSKHTRLPSIIFDEIDTGISGEVAIKIGELISQMGATMQVVCITHLPQVAAKGHQQFKVYKKEDDNGIVTTDVVALRGDARIHEIAEMLSGKSQSDTAIEHAKTLLGAEHFTQK